MCLQIRLLCSPSLLCSDPRLRYLSVGHVKQNPVHNSIFVEMLRKYHSCSCRKLLNLWIMFSVVFGSSLFFPLLLYQTLSSGLFLLAAAEFHSGISGFSDQRLFRQFFVYLGFCFRPFIFSGSMPKISGSLPGFSSDPGMTVRNMHFFFLKKQDTSGKTGLRDFMLLHCESETELPERSTRIMGHVLSVLFL